MFVLVSALLLIGGVLIALDGLIAIGLRVRRDEAPHPVIPRTPRFRFRVLPTAVSPERVDVTQGRLQLLLGAALAMSGLVFFYIDFKGTVFRVEVVNRPTVWTWLWLALALLMFIVTAVMARWSARSVSQGNSGRCQAAAAILSALATVASALFAGMAEYRAWQDDGTDCKRPPRCVACACPFPPPPPPPPDPQSALPPMVHLLLTGFTEGHSTLPAELSNCLCGLELSPQAQGAPVFAIGSHDPTELGPAARRRNGSNSSLALARAQAVGKALRAEDGFCARAVLTLGPLTLANPPIGPYAPRGNTGNDEARRVDLYGHFSHVPTACPQEQRASAPR